MKRYSKVSLTNKIKSCSQKPFLEISESQIEKLKNFNQVLLVVLAIMGAIMLSASMPGILEAIKMFYRMRNLKIPKYREKNKEITNAFYYLKKQRYINILREKGYFKVYITKKGRERIKKLEFRSISIPKSNHWDGKFWQVAADIPTKYRKSADAFRSKIKTLGFFPFQRTLWFYPFDPRREIEIISNLYNISSFVAVMKIEILDPADKRVIKKYFQHKNLI